MISRMLPSKSLLMTMRKSAHLFAPIPTFCLKREYKFFQADPVFHCLFTKSLQNSTSIGTIGWVYMLQIIKPVALINYSLFSENSQLEILALCKTVLLWFRKLLIKLT